MKRFRSAKPSATPGARKAPARNLPDARPARPEKTSMVGIVKRDRHGWSLLPTDRRDKDEVTFRPSERPELFENQLVLAKLFPAKRPGRREAEILESLGAEDAPGSASRIAIAANDIPTVFSPEALAEAKAARPTSLGQRTDLRAIPLVTIDGPDAKDFDDAVFAEPLKDGGFHLIVAIADVAHYVRPGSALERDAFTRGNSTYFPDRVVPMLPEALSNDLCSLKPREDRACLAAHLTIDQDGQIQSWRFERGLMRSHARLRYAEVQAAHDGKPNEATQPLLDNVIAPLYAAYACLARARVKRGTLELDLPERQVNMDGKGNIKSITLRERLDAHRLIEEFMILANVAAAAQLEGKGGALYRIHDRPTEMKLLALREFLDGFGISLVPARQLHPRFLTHILENASGKAEAQVINEVMLRAQSQAVYSAENIGHFGLALGKYAHFTSPIRRYADLIVHRGLVRALSLGNDGLTEEEIKNLSVIAEHISNTERRSITAERGAVDRLTSLFMAGKVGESFPARVSGVAHFGLFVRLNDTGAEGIVPFSALPRDFYDYNEQKQALVGKRTGKSYQLGAALTVRLDRADKVTGSLGFEVEEEGAAAKKADRPSYYRKPKPKGETKPAFGPRVAKKDRKGKGKGKPAAALPAKLSPTAKPPHPGKKRP